MSRKSEFAIADVLMQYFDGFDAELDEVEGKEDDPSAIVDMGDEANSLKNYFTSNVEHVKVLEQEAILHLACGYARSKQINLFAKDEFMKKFGLPDEIETLKKGEKLLASIQQYRKLMEQKSAQNGVSLKFVELCKHYEFDDFEQKILLILFVASNSFRFYSLFEECDINPWETRNMSMSVGTILLILCRDFIDQLDKRRYFAIDHPLVKYEIIELSLYNNLNILRADIEINDRFCRFVMDDQNLYDTDFNCISSEISSVDIDQVIIDEKIKNDVILYTESFFNNSENRKRLSELYGYGVGLTFLFHGPSGTGKTMLAHGLANHFGKKLYSVNVEGMNNESISFEDALKYAFKEARINNGIVFLDECDDMLAEKSRESRTFMIEVEKANCVTILATNTAVKLDPAMDRRINLKSFFPMSDERQRAKIWKALTPANIHLTEEDFQELAGKYIFTGGLIKNTLVMALNNINFEQEISDEMINLTAVKEIHAAARYQANSIFDHNGYGTVITPTLAIEDLSINKKEKDKLLSLIRYYPVIQNKGRGFCGLISSTDPATGHDCLEALAQGCDAKLRLFSMASVFNLNKTYDNWKNRMIDPFSQREMSAIDYVFKTRPGQPEIITLIDDINIFASSSRESLKDLLIHLRSFSGTLFVLSSTTGNKNIPIEFTFNLHLNFPSISLQTGEWKSSFTGLNEGEICQLVKQYPMHVSEIDFVARTTSINAMLNENRTQVNIDDVMCIAAKLRKNKHNVPKLFGVNK